VLFCGEAGVGDEIINARFGQVVRARGGSAIWDTPKALSSLFSRARGLDQVLSTPPNGTPRLKFDYWVPCMDSTQALGLDLHEIPNEPYLSADPQYLRKWAKLLPPAAGLRVGIRWQGNALYEQDLMRAVPFRLLESLAAIPGVTLYSLQRDEGSEERPLDSPVIDLGPRLETWEDTAAAVASLDLVISSCTSVPHLAAAMGIPTWIVCPLSCYYIWATPGDTSHWYPSLRLYRQTRFDSWIEPIGRVRAELEALAAKHCARNGVVTAPLT
jgi:hypothetical protein